MHYQSLLQPPPPITKKINRLYNLLVCEKNLFEEAASQVADTALRCSILSVAQQNNQYAAELSAHLTTTNCGDSAGTDENNPRADAPGHPVFVDERGLLQFCSSNERKIVTAYKRILAQADLYEGLRRMMHYQLSGIQFACTQLKLLRSLRPANKHDAIRSK